MISLQHVYKRYTVGDVQTEALKDINLTINEGEFVVVLGPSGSGKSTLLNVSGCLDDVTEGTIMINDQDITKLSGRELTNFRREYIGFVFQQYNLMPNLTVYENIEVGARLSKNAYNIEKLLEDVMMQDYKMQFPYQLSGGQQQRVAIARALAKNPAILFCDEPTGALDEQTGKAVLELLQQVNEQFKTTIFLITHNLGIVEIADVIVKMKSGEIVEVIRNEHKKQAYEVSWI